MNNGYQHLLSKHGILVSFNIAKRVKKSQVDAIKRSLKKKNLSDSEFEEQLKEKVVEKTKYYLNENDIPGLEFNDKEFIKIDPKIQKKVVDLADKVALYCKTNGLNKEHVIILVQAIFHLLKISNRDVADFKEKYNLESDDDDDYLDEDDNNEDF